MTDEPKSYRQLRFRRPPGACELLLIRHGESAPDIEGKGFPLLDGHGDPPLHPEGEIQAVKVADRLVASGEQIERIYVTTLQRTHQTAAPLAERLGLEPEVEPDLREVYLGEWEGGGFRKAMAEGHPIGQKMMAEQRWDVIPGAEPADAFAERVERAIRRIAAENADRTVAVFSHGGVIGQILAMTASSRGFAFTPDNGSISHIVVDGDRWTLRRFNDTAHLHPGFTVAPEPLT